MKKMIIMTNIMLVTIMITMIKMMIETTSSTLQSSCEWSTSLSGVCEDNDVEVVGFPNYHVSGCPVERVGWGN